jgi:predicted Zn finger-like uncharacterized protein
MLIVCPSCASEYTIDPAKLGAEGRTLRCAICRDTWFVSPDGAVAMDRQAPQAVPEAPAATVLPSARAERPPKRAARHWAKLALAAGLALAVIPVGAIGVQKGREALNQRMGPAPPSLVFRDVTSQLVEADGARLLVVEGAIANGGTEPARLHPLEFLVRNGNEQVLATWTAPPPQPTLAAGETARFATRLASPPADGRQVRVHFTKAAGIAVAAR